MTPSARLNKQKDSNHRQIISELYEQELPEMPTMRDESDGYYGVKNPRKNLAEASHTSGGYELQDDIEGSNKRGFRADPDQEKKQKIWEAIQKEAEDDGEEDQDSDEDDIDAGVAYSEESEESESEDSKEKDIKEETT